MANMAFYHMTRSTADDALPALLQKTLQQGKRAMVCCAADLAPKLSAAIWSFGEGSWLPHGIDGNDDDDASLCPIWLSDAPEKNPNNASYMFFINGMDIASIDDKERIFVLFDGTNEAAVSTARQQWKTCREAGHDLSYWQQDGAGKWMQSA